MKFGINEAKGSGPAYQRHEGVRGRLRQEVRRQGRANYVDHNTFQESINTYLQGSPDDVFTWFAGYRMQQFAEDGLITDLSDLWPIDGMGDAFKEAVDLLGRQAVLRADTTTTRGRCSTASRCSTRTAGQPPTNYDDMIALAQDMQGKGVTPFAFGDKDGWPAMGTFDILNMRINGFDFHMSLMGGDEAWDSNEVKQVFETWKDLLPYHQADPLGRTWQEAATSLAKGEAGMMTVRHLHRRRDRRTPWTTSTSSSPRRSTPSIGADSLDAPIDGFALAAGGPEPGRRQGDAQVARHRRGAGRRQRRRGRPDDRRQLQREPGRLHRRCSTSRPRWSGAAGQHRPVPGPRHRHRLRLHGDDPVDPGRS